MEENIFVILNKNFLNKTPKSTNYKRKNDEFTPILKITE